MEYKKTVKTEEERRQISEMTPRRRNTIIDAVNRGDPADLIEPPLNPGEAKYYEDISNELAEWRKNYPRAAFWPVELNYEEIDTSIYGDDFLDQF